MKHYLFYPSDPPFIKPINRLELNSYGRALLVFFSLLFSTLATNAQTCKVTDYLYLNDVTKNNNGDGVGFVHKMRLNSDKTATEIHSTGTKPWFPSGGVLKTPHGLGQDLNGNLYIGQTGDGPIAKIKCDGTLVKGNFIDDGGFNIISKDGFLYVNSNDGQRINRYALCDGSAQGYITLGGDYTYGSATLKDWGLDIAADGTFYASAGFNFTDRDKNTFLYRFKPTNADFTNHTTYTANKSTGVGGTLKSGTGTNGISDRNEVWGITHDLDGNMYLVVRDWADPSDTETWILKFDKNFNLIDSMVELTSSPTGGIEGARGIVYYAPWDRLLIAGGPDGDCIAKVRPSDMAYVGALAENEPNQTPKTLRIASEACPISASLTVDTTLCNVEAGDKIFLQNIIGKCNAPICGGTWTANSGNAGITFNECDLSFTVTNVAIGCGKFVLQNEGGTCGDFTITVNVDFANVTAPVIAGDQTVCADSQSPAAFTITTPATGSNTIKYQWQKSTVSCTEGFSDIAGANAEVYAPGIVSQPTYYRVVTTVDGSCTPPHGNCTAISNCVTVTTQACCTKPDAGTDITMDCMSVGSTSSTAGSLQLSGTPTGGSWADKADNSTGATVNGSGLVTVTYATAKGKSFEFIYTIDNCSDTIKVTVPDCTIPCFKPSIGLPIPAGQTLCKGDAAVQYTFPDPDAGTNDYQWYSYTNSNTTIGTALSGATGVFTPTAVQLPPADGSTYYYAMIATAKTGPSTCSDTIWVAMKVNAKPVIKDGSAKICTGETLNLTTAIVDYAALQNPVWRLTAANGAVIDTPNAVQPTSTTTYVLVAQNEAGCQDTADVVVTVNSKPNAGTDQTLACANAAENALTTSTTLTPVTTGGTFTQIGTAPAAATITGNAVSGMTVAGTYQFMYTLDGCKDTVAVTVQPCAGCIKPGGITLVKTLPTCINGIAQSNGKITLSAVTNTDKYAISSGSSYSGTATYATATAIATTPVDVKTGIVNNGNPYTLRLYNGSETCFKDTTIRFPIVDCVPPCIKSAITLTGTPACSADVQTYSLSFSIANKIGTVKVSNGTLSGNNPYTVIGIPSGATLKITDSLSAICKSDTVIMGPNCNCNPPLPALVTPSLTVCSGDTFPTLKATVIGLATVEWFATATSTTVLFTGLNYKPAGNVTAAGATFYAQARSTDPTCPTAISTGRVMATVNAVEDCNREVDLALNKSINKKIAQIGDVLTYTLKVWNESGTNATGVEVVDSIATTVQFIAGSFTASRGSAVITGNVIKWTIGNIAANGDTVTLTYRIKATQEGVHFNTAEICKTNEKDVDSTPCNHDDDEDDIDRQCFSVPFKLCPGEKVEANVPSHLTNVQWFKNGSTTPVASGNTVLLTDIGTYAFTAANQSCPATGCCPVIIEEGVNCCPADLCIPFTIKQIKKAGKKK